MEPALEIDGVEWLSSTPQDVVVAVTGRWSGPIAPGQPVLLVDDGQQRHAFVAVSPAPGAAEAAADPGAWRVTFAVPIELRPRLADGLALEVGAVKLPLPGAVAGAALAVGGEETSPAKVIDRTVLAERRARRAELTEQALSRRVEAAEATVKTLEDQLANVELRLEESGRERDLMSAKLAKREREATAQAEQLRLQLAAVERQVEQLSGELERVRRELAEAEHMVAAERAALHRAQQQLAVREQQVERREAELSNAGREIETRLTAARSVQHEVVALRDRLAEQRDGLEVRLFEVERRAAEAQRELDAERAAREQAEHELAEARRRASDKERGLDQRIAELEAELERRQRIQEQVQGELRKLHDELESVRAAAERQAQRNAGVGSLLEGLESTIARLRDELRALEQRKRDADPEAERARGQLTENGERARRDPAEIARLRSQSDARARSLEQAERTIAAVRRSASDLQDLLERERKDHARAAAALRAQLESERGAFTERLAATEHDLKGQLEAQRRQLEAQRRQFEAQVGAVEGTVDRLSVQLRAAATEMAARDEALEQARAAERAALERIESEREAAASEALDAPASRSQLAGSAMRAVAAELVQREQAQAERCARELVEAALAEEHDRVAHERAVTADLSEALERRAVAERDARRQLEALQEEMRALREPAATGPAAVAPTAPILSAPGSELVPPAPQPGFGGEAEALADRDALRHRREMTEALAQAVVRLRARVADVTDADDEATEQAPAEQSAADDQATVDDGPAAEQPADQAPLVEDELGADDGQTIAVDPLPQEPAQPMPAQQPPADAVALEPRLLPSAPRRSLAPWLAAAIRRVASERDAKLAGELILELLPAQGIGSERPLVYELTIQEVGAFRVSIGVDEAAVARAGPHIPGEEIEFVLEGPAAAYAELAAGGVTRRKLPGVRVKGHRRRARRLCRTRRAAVTLADLAEASVQVWPGLLLLALAEAIDPAWTVGRRFVLAFSIQGSPGATLFFEIRDGEPLGVSHLPPDGDGDVAATVYASEAQFLCLLAGTALPPGERVLLSGDADSLELFLRWSDRAQGLAAAE